LDHLDVVCTEFLSPEDEVADVEAAVSSSFDRSEAQFRWQKTPSLVPEYPLEEGFGCQTS
jgi:hypothetical protein